jgi:hypothetical protein
MGFVGDFLGSAADAVGDVLGGAADIIEEGVDFLGDVATEAKEIVLETPYVADIISIAYPPAAPYLQAAKAANAAANGDWLTAGLSAMGAYKGFNPAGQTSTAGMYEVWDDNLGEWVQATDLPSNWDFGTTGGLTDVRNIQTGNAFQTTFSNLSSPTAMASIDSTFGQGLNQALTQAGVQNAPTGNTVSDWLSENVGGTSGMWSGLGRLGAQAAAGYLSQKQAEDLYNAQLAASQGLAASGDPFSVYGPGASVAYNPQTRTATLGLTPDWQQAYTNYMQRAGTTGERVDLLSQDPFALGGQYYEQYVEPDLLKAQQRERLALESRLLGQGMLGATGGALRQEAQETGFQTAQTGARAAAIGQGFSWLDTLRAQEAADIASAQGILNIPTQMANIGVNQAATLAKGQQMGALNTGMASTPYINAQYAPYQAAINTIGGLFGGQGSAYGSIWS